MRAAGRRAVLAVALAGYALLAAVFADAYIPVNVWIAAPSTGSCFEVTEGPGPYTQQPGYLSGSFVQLQVWREKHIHFWFFYWETYSLYAGLVMDDAGPDFHKHSKKQIYWNCDAQGICDLHIGVYFKGGPYVLTGGTTFHSGGNEGQPFKLFPKDDNIAEPTETFTVRLEKDNFTEYGHSFTISGDPQKVCVHDNDVAVASVEPARAHEGEALQFKAKLSKPSSTELVLNVSVNTNTAVARLGTDYTLGGSTLVTFPACRKEPCPTAATEQWIDYVSTIENGVADGDRTLTLTLSEAYKIGPPGCGWPNPPYEPCENVWALPDYARLSATAASAVGTIIDDDTAEVSIAQGVESVEEGGTLVYTVSVSTPVTVADLHVQAVPVSGGSAATEGVDYEFVEEDGVVTITAGTTTTTLTVSTIEDTVVETTETVTLRPSLPSGRNPGLSSLVTARQHTVSTKIRDDDETVIGFVSSPQVTGSQQVATAGAASGVTRGARALAQNQNLPEWGRADEGERMAFTLNLGNPVAQQVVLRYATSTGTASVADFTMVTSGAMTFAANERQATAYVQTTEDHVAEGDETFTIRFEEHPAHPLPPGVSLPGGGLAALGRIVDDDVRGVTVSPRELLLFETGTTTAAYAVRLATQPSTGVTVTPSSSAAGTATVAPASLSFGTGDWSTAQKVTVTAVADGATGDRTATVSHAVSGYGTLTTAPAVAVTVVDDDAAGVTVTPTALSMVEGGAGSYRVVLRTAPTSAVTVTVASSSGTVATASPGSLSFGTSDWSDAKTVTVTGAADDGDVNGTRQATLTHTVSGYGAVTTAAPVTVTVTDNDQAGLTIEPLSLTMAEGTTATYRVRLNYRPTTTTAVTVTPSVDGTLATVAPATLNYTQTTWSGWQTVTVTARANDVATGDRTTEVTHAAGGGYVGKAPPAVAVTITDDDTAGLVITPGGTGPVRIAEGSSRTFTVRLRSAPATGTVTVRITRTAGDADLAASPATLLFTGGDWSSPQTFKVTAAGDADAADGRATIRVSAAGYADAVNLTFEEADRTPLVSIAAPGTIATVDETTGTASLRFPVSVRRVAGDPGRQVTVAYQSSDGAAPCPHPDLNLPAATTGTAVAGSDYTLTSGTLTFAARSSTATGTTTQTQVVAVPVLRTIEDEASYECLTVELGNAVNAALGRSATSGVIVDGDFPRVVSIAGTTVGEPLRARSTTATFTVNLDVARSAAETTVEWRTEAGSATAGSDFVAAEGTVTFQPGEVEQTIDVTVLDDGAVEREETFGVTLSKPSANTSVGVSSATGTIVSNDAPEVLVADVTVTESALPTTATFTVRLSQPAAWVMRVAYATSASTALAGRDYAAATGTLTFDVGDDERTIGVTVLDDEESEADETFALNLFWVSPREDVAPDPVAQATVTVYDDDRPGVPQGRVGVIEPDAGQTSATFVVSLEEPAVRELAYAWATADGTAEAGSDYTAASGRLTFAVGATTQAVAVAVLGDGAPEADETFTLTLTPVDRFTGAPADEPERVLNATILDNDWPGVQVGDGEVIEPYAGQTAFAEFEVRLAEAAKRPLEYAWATADGTAQADTDYRPASYRAMDRLTFAVGATTQAVAVAVLEDGAPEEDETFTLTLVRVNRFTGEPEEEPEYRGTGTIRDNDHPGIEVKDVAVDEPDAGQTAIAEFEVRLAWAAKRPLEYAWATADGTAKANSDYTPVSDRRLTFEPEQTTQTVVVEVLGDVEPEGDETFTLTLTPVNPFTDELEDGLKYLATGTIRDNDQPDDQPGIEVEDVTVDEPDAGQTVIAEFEVRLAEAATLPLAYAWATADDTAKAGSDYTEASDTITFEPGEETQTVEVEVLGDDEPEANETFILTLTPVNRFTGELEEGPKSLVTGTILDNDQPVIEVEDVEVREPDAGQAASAEFEVRLRTPAKRPLAYAWATADGTAQAGSDYTEASDTITFEPGEETKTVPVVVLGDDEPEADETFNLTLTPVNRFTGELEDELKSLVTGTILDDDRPVIEVEDVEVPEPDAGQTASAEFEVRLAEPAKRPLAYAYATADGTAKAGSDYKPESDGLLTFEPGEERKTVEVEVLGDDEPEADETFTLTLTPVNRFTGELEDELKSLVTGTILDDDRPVIEVEDVEVPEPDAGQTASAEFEVRLAEPAKRPLAYAYATADGTARAGSDYTEASDTITFEPGEERKTVEVEVLGDDEPEADETFNLTLTPVNRFTGELEDELKSLVTGTILDDDRPEVEVGDVEVPEPDAGQTVSAEFEVRLAEQAKRPLEYAWATADGTAQAGSDYTEASDTITFEPGEETKTVEVEVLGDDEPEADETFNLTLTPVNRFTGELEDEPKYLGSGTILDDDTERWRGRALAAAMTVFGQSLAGDAVEVIGRRGAMRSAARFTAVLDGHELWGAGVPAAALESEFPAWWWYGDAPPLRTLTLTELATGSSFDVLLDAAGKWSVWGSVTGGGFRTEGGAVEVDGLRITAYGGFDYRLTPDLLAGLALSYAHGAVDYEAPEVAPYGGEVGLHLYSVLPYAHWQPVDTLGLWGMLGVGAGNALLRDTIGDAETPLRLLLAAVGARQEVATLGLVALAVKADGYALWMHSEAARKVAAAAAEAQRVRVLVEGSTDLEVALLGSLIRPTVELGVNWERTADTQGFGGEVGGEVALSNAEVGLQVTAGGRYLIRQVFADEEGGDEWGARMGVEWNPDGERTGPWAAAATAWGYASGDAERLWATPPAQLEVGAGAAPGPGAELAVGYGLQVPPDRALLTPSVGLTLPAAGALRYRLGLGLALGSATDLGMTWEDAIARSDPSIFRILVEGTHRW